jgi:anti-anti-sigma regulatory factor
MWIRPASARWSEPTSNRQHGGRTLALVGVSDRVRNALEVTRVEQFFRFFDSVDAAETATAA